MCRSFAHNTTTCSCASPRARLPTLAANLHRLSRANFSHLPSTMASSCAARPAAWTAALRNASHPNTAACATVRRAFPAPRYINSSSKPLYSNKGIRSNVSSASNHAKPASRLLRPLQARTFSSTPRTSYKTVEEAKSKHRLGVSPLDCFPRKTGNSRARAKILSSRSP